MSAAPWEAATPGLMELPSGRLVRGRGVRLPFPEGQEPTYGLYLLGKRPPSTAWESRWLRWPDFGLPLRRSEASEALREAWERAAEERVEIACGGGHGRTGTAMACLAVIDGVPNGEAVAYVREHYRPRAVETPWQHRYIARFE